MSGLERLRTSCDGNHGVACDAHHATKSRRWRNFATIGAGFRHSCLAGETILGLGESISLRMKGGAHKLFLVRLRGSPAVRQVERRKNQRWYDATLSQAFDSRTDRRR